MRHNSLGKGKEVCFSVLFLRNQEKSDKIMEYILRMATLLVFVLVSNEYSGENGLEELKSEWKTETKNSQRKAKNHRKNGKMSWKDEITVIHKTANEMEGNTAACD